MNSDRLDAIANLTSVAFALGASEVVINFGATAPAAEAPEPPAPQGYPVFSRRKVDHFISEDQRYVVLFEEPCVGTVVANHPRSPFGIGARSDKWHMDFFEPIPSGHFLMLRAP